MASMQQVSSVSGGDGQVDDKKRKKMLANRESARRSRMRKQHQLDDLLNQVAKLQQENFGMMHCVNEMEKLYTQFEWENTVLRAQKKELSHTSESLESVIAFVEGASAFPLDIPDPWLNTWQLPGPSHPILAANMFQF